MLKGLRSLRQTIIEKHFNFEEIHVTCLLEFLFGFNLFDMSVLNVLEVLCFANRIEKELNCQEI